ncbi:DUF262 domain-containing HNH endonuclease family protein [Mesorhizobium sp. M0051]|uniref:DUF262 domain-containing protein n=1 Tax=Mesorhizobium sp. M0051 TaxID=2956862 RepID=UPI0033366561
MEIAPDKQNIDRVFSNTTYYIDFYQREYKWTVEPISRLLEDIFYAFDETYKGNSKLDPGPEIIIAKYPWYYLNTYVTNTIDGRVYVVDGQQRLTTLTLILIKLHHMAAAEQSALADWIKGKIAGQDGFKKRFWMNHERHLATVQALFEDQDEVPTNSGITAVNMLDNYNLISEMLNGRLSSKHKLETFVFYFLHRLVLINLSVAQTDVPMVFEVINDRGVRLRPYEILKGKLLGQIDKVELDANDYNGLWEKSVQSVNRFRTDEIDTFFTYLLKAKFSSSRGTAERFDKDYHREMFKKDVNDALNLDHNPSAVKTFISKDFRYFTALYARIQGAALGAQEALEHVYYNRLNGMDSQNLLILSACVVDDDEEDEKIRLVAFHLDRLFALLRLQRAYDSNEFNDAVYEVANEIRGKPASTIPPAFERKLLELLSIRRGVEVLDAFEYAQFKNTSITDVPTRFTRYFFARLDAFLAAGLNKPAYKVDDLVTKTGAVNGYHIEHIMSHNPGNIALYEENEEQFEIDRNRLGAVLLLKGRDNISSSNESYGDKLKSYAGTLYWNETLRADAYKAKLDFTDLIKKHQLAFESYEKFGPEQIENRQRLLFALSQIIWS